jgi:hypothetical protein
MANPITTFTLFSSLPKELRLQIWALALEPCVITLHRNTDRNRGRYYFPFNAVTIKIPLFMTLTTCHPSLDVIQRVCAESKLFCRRRYMELGVWDIRKNCLGTHYDPNRDVVYFSHHINPLVLQDFAAQYPVETSCMETIALPGRISSTVFSRTDVLATLHVFEKLKEVIIVLGNATRGHGHIYEPGQRESWLGGDQKPVWTLPDDAERVLERIKREKWPDWKPPIVTVVASQEDILSRKVIAQISGIAIESLPSR